MGIASRFARSLLARVALSAFVVTALVSCDPIEEVRERLGVRRDSGGTVLVRYIPCSDEVVSRLVVREYEGKVEPGQGTVRWEIEGSHEGDLEIAVGSVPVGFRELTPLAGPLLVDRSYVVEVDSDRQRMAARSFEVSALRADAYLSFADEYVSPTVFEERAAERCAAFGGT